MLLCLLAVPYTGYVPPSTLISSNRTIHTIDFSAVTVEELQSFDIDFVFKIDKTGKHMQYIMYYPRIALYCACLSYHFA